MKMTGLGQCSNTRNPGALARRRLLISLKDLQTTSPKRKARPGQPHRLLVRHTRTECQAFRRLTGMNALLKQCPIPT